MNSIIAQNFFTYTLTNSLTGLVFYVGKGHNDDRMDFHEKEAKQGVKSYKCNTIRKIWRDGGYVIKEKAGEFPIEQDAFIHEWCLINLIYGRENLTNMTDGGEGINGYQHTDEGKQTMRQLTTQRWESPQFREKQLQSMADPDVRRRCGTANIGNTRKAKTYPGFLAPDGVTIYENVKNLNAFSQEHNLQDSAMCLVAQGKQYSHLGWTLYPPIEKPPSYTGTGYLSPDGTLYEASSIANLTEFCKIHGLNQSAMSGLGTGNHKSHKGWTRYPPPEYTRYETAGFRSPDGTRYTDIPHLHNFCIEHGLDYNAMAHLNTGKISSYKGWTSCSSPEMPPTYSFLSPDGVIHTCDNLRGFCKEHQLSQGCMYEVHKGNRHSHKGWTKHNHDLVQPTLF